MNNKEQIERKLNIIDKFSSYFVIACSRYATSNLSNIPSPKDMIRKSTLLNDNIQELKSIILNQPKTYTRKELQKACAQAYQRGVDNRPYIEKFDEWFDDKSEE